MNNRDYGIGKIIYEMIKKSTREIKPISWDNPDLFVRTDEEAKDIFKRSLKNSISFQSQLDLDKKNKIKKS